MTIRIKYSGDLARALDRADGRAESIAAAAGRDVGHEFVTAARQLAGNSGPYAQSFTVRPDGNATEAGSDSPLAAILERGRRPGRRPSPNLIRSVKGGSQQAAERAADRIAARGTKGRWIVKKAARQIRTDGTVERITRAAVEAMGSLTR